eukprot:TRINITY_DN11087_c0_g1_i1.p1 TRINITY_DN11087_c0_g1~~TRINITY_DN11087_c0_g1_i1.p1  ORF type:complete len:432 (+),score=12.50 TRINITY_DN11087_c0_g1_i1:348-1643(+)
MAAGASRGRQWPTGWGTAGPGLVAGGTPPRAQPIRRGPPSNLGFNPQGHIVGGAARVEQSCEAGGSVARRSRLRRPHSMPSRDQVRAALRYSKYGEQQDTGSERAAPLGRRHVPAPEPLWHPAVGGTEVGTGGTPRRISSSRPAHTDGFGCIPVDAAGSERPRGLAQSPQRHARTVLWDAESQRTRRGRRALALGVEHTMGQGSGFLQSTQQRASASPDAASAAARGLGRRAVPPPDCIDWFHGGRVGSLRSSSAPPPPRPGRRAPHCPSTTTSRSVGVPPLPTGTEHSCSRGRRVVAVPPASAIESTGKRFGVARSHTPPARPYSIVQPTPQAATPQPARVSGARGVSSRLGHFDSAAAMAQGHWSPLTRAQGGGSADGGGGSRRVHSGPDSVAWNTMRIWHEAASSPRKGGRAAGREHPRGSADIISWR